MSTHNIWFNGELTKIILQLSSNNILTCSEFKWLKQLHLQDKDFVGIKQAEFG